VLLGIMLALCGGVGIAAFAEYNDRRIYGSADLVAIFGAPPLGTIPEIPASDSSRN
jgi:capsular polysaccharide biosynthesis protein